MSWLWALFSRIFGPTDKTFFFWATEHWRALLLLLYNLDGVCCETATNGRRICLLIRGISTDLCQANVHADASRFYLSVQLYSTSKCENPENRRRQRSQWEKRKKNVAKFLSPALWLLPRRFASVVYFSPFEYVYKHILLVLSLVARNVSFQSIEWHWPSPPSPLYRRQKRLCHVIVTILSYYYYYYF